MTLSTDIRVLEPTDPKALHDWVNLNLLDAPNAKMDVREDGIWNEAGQGLDAWLITEHANGAELPQAGQPYPQDYDPKYYDSKAEADAAYEEAVESSKDNPTGYVNLDFDTAYGYRTDLGGCTELHAMFIIRLNTEYFEPRNLTFAWKNEYTGEWHNGLDGISEFLESGDGAMDWFNNVALPAINHGL